MTKRQISISKTQARVMAATGAIVVGDTYFLSSFYDKDGCFVKVLAKSTKKNGAGWNSSVGVEVIEPVGGDASKPRYTPGTLHNVNALNLYRQREDAHHTRLFAKP